MAVIFAKKDQSNCLDQTAITTQVVKVETRLPLGGGHAWFGPISLQCCLIRYVGAGRCWDGS